MGKGRWSRKSHLWTGRYKRHLSCSSSSHSSTGSSSRFPCPGKTWEQRRAGIPRLSSPKAPSLSVLWGGGGNREIRRCFVLLAAPEQVFTAFPLLPTSSSLAGRSLLRVKIPFRDRWNRDHWNGDHWDRTSGGHCPDIHKCDLSLSGFVV